MFYSIQRKLDDERNGQRGWPRDLLLSTGGYRTLRQEVIERDAGMSQVGVLFGMKVLIDPELPGERFYFRWSDE